MGLFDWAKSKKVTQPESSGDEPLSTVRTDTIMQSARETEDAVEEAATYRVPKGQPDGLPFNPQNNHPQYFSPADMYQQSYTLGQAPPSYRSAPDYSRNVREVGTEQYGRPETARSYCSTCDESGIPTQRTTADWPPQTDGFPERYEPRGVAMGGAYQYEGGNRTPPLRHAQRPPYLDKLNVHNRPTDYCIGNTNHLGNNTKRSEIIEYHTYACNDPNCRLDEHSRHYIPRQQVDAQRPAHTHYDHHQSHTHYDHQAPNDPHNHASHASCYNNNTCCSSCHQHVYHHHHKCCGDDSATGGIHAEATWKSRNNARLLPDEMLTGGNEGSSRPMPMTIGGVPVVIPSNMIAQGGVRGPVVVKRY